MSLWVCVCSTRYAVGLPACPHCGSTDYTDEGGERPSVGSSSSTSSPNTEPANEPSPGGDRRRARTAVSPSNHTGASSTAPPVTGDPTRGDLG